MANLALSLLFYPGLALALILALVFGWLTEGRVRLGWLRGAAWGSLDGLLSLASILLAALTLALLPWPLHPAAGWAWAGRPAALWAAIEGAFLLPLLAGLLAPAALGERAASREAQMMNAAGAEEGLDEDTASLVRFARTARGAALLAALIVASLPPALFQPWVALLLIAGLFILVALLLNRVAGALPRLTLPAALRWCWWRALPLAVVGLVYLIVIS